ncbi:hypothetical protein NHJ13051_005189 [Beauveria bassiana]
MADRRSARPTAGPSNPPEAQRISEPKLSRQKHWPFMACFIGGWVQTKQEQLEAICEATYNMPPPCPIDPAILFDMLRIRRLVDDAASDVEREEEGQSSPFSRETLGSGIRARLRRQACQKLSEAYRIDELVCSMAMLRCAPSLEEVSSRVVKENPANVDANHAQHSESQYEEIPDEKQPDEKAGGQSEPGETTRQKAPRKKVLEHDKPDSLLGQLHFHRGSISLQMAYHHISNSFAPEGHASETQDTSPADLSVDEKKQIESRKLVKRYARSAMRDFKAFLGRFQYSPDWPMEAAKDFEDFFEAVNTAKKPSRAQLGPRRPPANNRLYAVSQLFEAEEIPNLPPYPPPTMAGEELGPVTDLFDAVVAELKETSTVCESVTYHPLLLEALHALLLCHCLVQTSPTEIRRHAYMVARLSRLCDGYPIFKVGFFPSRFDWNQVLSEAPFLPLAAAWADLCAPKCRAAQCKLIFDVSTTAAIEKKVKTKGATTEGVTLAGIALGTLHTEYRNTLMQLSQDKITPDEILLREAYQPPGNRLEQNELPDAVLNLATGTGHAGDVVRWLNEVPLVRMGRKKKSRKNVAARSDPEETEVSLVPTADQGGRARSDPKQPDVTVVETTLPIR